MPCLSRVQHDRRKPETTKPPLDQKGGGVARAAWMLAFLLWLVALAVLFLQSEVNPVRPKAQRIACKEQYLKRIGLALSMYASDNQGEFPPSLYPLLTVGYLTPMRLFLCPRDNPRDKRNQRNGQRREEENVQRGAPTDPRQFCTDYLYVSPPQDGGEQRAIVMDRYGNHERYGNVLFVDPPEGSDYKMEFRSFANVEWETCYEKYGRTNRSSGRRDPR